jgi:hypothetical protein
MKNELDNLYHLFSDNDQEVYQALIDKKDWLFTPLFLRGDLNQVMDDLGKAHYRKIESLVDEVLPFEKVTLGTNLGLEKDKIILLQNSIEHFRTLYLERNVADVCDAPFFVEYDFAKIDNRSYYALLANFYPCMSQDELEINYNEVTNSIVEQLKLMMIGPKGRFVLIIESSLLINDSFFAPYMVRIHANRNADFLLREELRQIAKEKGIIYVEG